MLLHYLKYSPTGNITVLVTTPVPRPDQPGVASRLLAAVGGEQVGFIEPAADPRCPARLQMMGGEFCGNATMSLGAMLTRKRAPADGEALDMLLEVSGLDAPVPCRITGRRGDASPDAHPGHCGDASPDAHPDRRGDASPDAHPGHCGDASPDAHPGHCGDASPDAHPGHCGDASPDAHPDRRGDASPDAHPPVGAALRRPPMDDLPPVSALRRPPKNLPPVGMADDVSPILGTVQMPLPLSIGEITLPADAGPLTVPVVTLPGITHLILPAETAPGEAELRRRLPAWNRAIGADALGALRFDAVGPSIDPLVYVPSVGTLVREHGCGSGTAAVGCHLAVTAGRDVEAPIAQPGGTISVRAALHNGRVAALSITGLVTLLEEGDVEV